MTVAESGAELHGGPDKVDELQRLAEALKTPRAKHKRELAEALRLGQLSQERYKLGLRALDEVKPSAGRQLLEKLPEMAGEHIGSALLFIVAGVSIESLIANSLISGADFLSLYLFILPLTLASVAIVWTIAKAENFLAALLGSGAILFVAAEVQNHLTGRHLMLKPALCSTSTAPNAGNCSGLEAVANYIAEVLSGYWHAFGPGTFIVAAGLGVAMGVMTVKH